MGVKIIKNRLFSLIVICLSVDCTIDLTIPDLQLVADHLTPEECRQLVAALHFHEFDPPAKLAAAERVLPHDLSCLELLLHWNSSPGEGKGGTHVQVTHRLNQIGREDVAQMLARKVFHELSANLNKSLEGIEVDETDNRETTILSHPPTVKTLEETPWLMLDNVLLVLVLLCVLTFVFILLFFCCRCCLSCFKPCLNIFFRKSKETPFRFGKQRGREDSSPDTSEASSGDDLITENKRRK